MPVEIELAAYLHEAPSLPMPTLYISITNDYIYWYVNNNEPTNSWRHGGRDIGLSVVNHGFVLATPINACQG